MTSCFVADLRYTVDKFRLRKMSWKFSTWITGREYQLLILTMEDNRLRQLESGLRFLCLVCCVSITSREADCSLHQNMSEFSSHFFEKPDLENM